MQGAHTASNSRPQNTVKTLAFVVARLILTAGAVGILVPADLVWIAQHSVNSGAFYVIAAVRVAFGLVLISAASGCRGFWDVPRGLG